MDPVTGGLLIGGSLISGYMGAEAAEAGAESQLAAQRYMTDEAARQFDLLWGAGETQREIGDINLRALHEYGGPDLMRDPGYQFRMQQGQTALENYLSGRGRLGGSALRAVTQYGQDLGSQEYQRAWERDVNRMSTLAGYGPIGVSSGAGASQNYMSSVGQGANLMAGAGMAGAGAYSAWNTALQGGIQNYLAYQQQQQFMDALNA